MIGKALPGILSRVQGKSGSMGMDTAMSPMGDGGMQYALDNAVNTMKGVGEPTDLSTSDSGGEYSIHPAKM